MIRTAKLSAFYTLITIIALFTVGCAKTSPIVKEVDAFDNLRTNVQDVVTDPARAGQSLALVDELQREFDDIKELRLERKKRIKALNVDYDASRAEFETLLDGIAQDRLANQERVSQTYRQLLEVITTEEWAKLAKSRNEAMQAAIKALQAI
jgi:PBP1b-binding outer membrane lipoprotein LpoB